MPKMASKSFGPDVECKHPWPDDCFVQCGESGIVLPAGEFEKVVVNADLGPLAAAKAGAVPGAYTTAFFEAFPHLKSMEGKSIFLRGEGGTILEAEDKCWKRYQRIESCPGHELERSKGYTNGMATCKHCGMMGTFMEPSTKCKDCGKPTDHYCDNERKDWFCEKCLPTAKDQPCQVCKKRDANVSYIKPWWASRHLKRGEEPFRQWLHPECNRGED